MICVLSNKDTRTSSFTINCLYEYRLLSLAHNCFYDFSPTPTCIKQLFMKYDCNCNLQRKLTFLLLKPKSELHLLQSHISMEFS